MMIFVFTMFKAELLCGSFAFFGYSAETLYQAAMLVWPLDKEFMARPSMRMKRGGSHAGIRIEVGLRECEARSNPCNQKGMHL